MKSEIELLKEIVDGSDNIVFFGGAGVSTESNIPDFRSPGGLYSQKMDMPPERILSYSNFIARPESYYEFHRKRMAYLNDAKPNKAHLKLAELERAGKLKAVVTQNIDNLHQKAGSVNVIELHGSAFRNHCMICRKSYDVDFILSGTGVPYCECGGLIKPGVVMFEESLDNDTINKAVNYISQADVLIVGGTSLVVYPAAGFINYYRGNKLVFINKSETSYDEKADLLINDSIGEVLSRALS